MNFSLWILSEGKWELNFDRLCVVRWSAASWGFLMVFDPTATHKNVWTFKTTKLLTHCRRRRQSLSAASRLADILRSTDRLLKEVFKCLNCSGSFCEWKSKFLFTKKSYSSSRPPLTVLLPTNALIYCLRITGWHLKVLGSWSRHPLIANEDLQALSSSTHLIGLTSISSENSLIISPKEFATFLW